MPPIISLIFQHAALACFLYLFFKYNLQHEAFFREPTWTCIGDKRGEWRRRVATRCPGSSSFDTKTHQQPGYGHELLRRKSSAFWDFRKEKNKEKLRGCGGGNVPKRDTVSLFPSVAQDVGSSMPYMWIQVGRLDLLIVGSLLFSQPLQGSSGGRIRLPRRGRFRAAGGWHLETSTHLCLQPSVCNSAI